MDFFKLQSLESLKCNAFKSRGHWGMCELSSLLTNVALMLCVK